MTTSAKLPIARDLQPRLTVIGVGGAGCNAVNNMIGAGLTGVNFVVANTDAQSLANSSADYRIQLGASLTEGLGAGSKPEIGEAAAEEALADIRDMVAGSHMVFVAAGMGGGTGTGAAAVIARVARELGILTVGVVTKPFQFEGARRMRTAEDGIARLRNNVDTLIVIPNQNLFRIATDKTTFAEAFVLADQVLYSGVACVVDLIVKEGLINLDFADVRTVMSGMGTAMMGTGEASGPGRATVAAEEAISNPLLDDVTLKGAKGLLLSITGGRSLTLYEVDEAASRVRQEVDPEANVIVGATFDETLKDKIRVSIVASGMVRNTGEARAPAEPVRQAPAYASSAPEVAVPPPAHGYSPAPYATPPAAADVHQRLSEALNHEAPAGAGYFGSSEANSVSPVSGPPPLPPHQGWMAPGNVRIEEAVEPPLADFESYAPSPRAYQNSEPLGAEPAFAPMPPAEFRRQRRMPEVEDFPVVGQREYMAKKSGGWGAAQQTPPPVPTSVSNATPRRSGWFSRFTGRSAQDSDSQAHERSHRTSGQAWPDTAEGRARSAPSREQDGQRTNGLKSQEMPGLPGFINGRRK
ncbi:MAG: cell division protein FtsZ [Hyphomicrobium sp.]